MAEKVFEAVCAVYKVNARDVRSTEKLKQIIVARRIIMYLLKRKLGLSYGLIGLFLGGKSCSTVNDGVEIVELRMGKDTDFHDSIEAFVLMLTLSGWEKLAANPKVEIS